MRHVPPSSPSIKGPGNPSEDTPLPSMSLDKSMQIDPEAKSSDDLTYFNFLSTREPNDYSSLKNQFGIGKAPQKDFLMEEKNSQQLSFGIVSRPIVKSTLSSALGSDKYSDMAENGESSETISNTLSNLMENDRHQQEAFMDTSAPTDQCYQTDIRSSLTSYHSSTCVMAMYKKIQDQKNANKGTKGVKIDKVGAGAITKRKRRAAKRSRTQNESIEQPMGVSEPQKSSRLTRVVAANIRIGQSCSKPVNIVNDENVFVPIPPEIPAIHKKNRRPTHWKTSVNKLARALEALDASEKKDRTTPEASKINHRRLRAKIARRMEDPFIFDEQRAVMKAFEAENAAPDRSTDIFRLDVNEDDNESVIDEDMEASGVGNDDLPGDL